jgi:tetratricopeptide (TPR) repeat protein
MKRFELTGLLLVLSVLAFGVFIPTLPHALVFDDEVYLVGNPIFKDPKSFTNLFFDFNSVAGFASKNLLDPDISTNFIMRPLTYGTFHLNHLLGGLQPRGYRFVNICIHLINALLVWRLSQILLRTGTARPQAEGRYCVRSLAPCLASLLFFIHPLQIESTVYIIQRATSLCCLFYLLGLLCHFQASASLTQIPKLSWRAASILSVLAAMFSKESAITAPVLAVALDIFVLGTAAGVALRNAAGLLLLVPYLPLMLLKVSAAQAGGLSAVKAVNIAHTSPDPLYALHYLMSQAEVWWRYLGLFVWPSSLNIDPDLRPILSLSEPRFLLSVSGWLLLLAGAFFLSRRQQSRMWVDPLFLSALWFILTLLPDSSVVPLPDLLAEHRTYIPLVGLCIGGAAALLAFPSPVFGKIALALAALVGLGTASVVRCRVWSSPVTLWQDTVEKSPGKVRCWLNLGAAYFEAGKLLESEKAFLQALRVEPTVPGASNLATVYLKLNQPERALPIALDGMKLRPTGYDHLLLASLGEALVRLGRPREAVAHYEELLQMNPSILLAICNLGHCHLQLGQFQLAREVFLAGLRHHPNQPNLLSGLAAAEAAASSFKLRLGP